MPVRRASLGVLVLTCWFVMATATRASAESIELGGAVFTDEPATVSVTGTGAPAASDGAIVQDGQWAPNNEKAVIDAQVAAILDGMRNLVETVSQLADDNLPHTAEINPEFFIKWRESQSEALSLFKNRYTNFSYSDGGVQSKLDLLLPNCGFTLASQTHVDADGNIGSDSIDLIAPEKFAFYVRNYVVDKPAFLNGLDNLKQVLSACGIQITKSVALSDNTWQVTLVWNVEQIPGLKGKTDWLRYALLGAGGLVAVALLGLVAWVVLKKRGGPQPQGASAGGAQGKAVPKTGGAPRSPPAAAPAAAAQPPRPAILPQAVVKAKPPSPKDQLCTTCLTVGRPATITKGSIWIEILLWILFFPAGIAYTIWRLVTRHKACAACGAQELLPALSPKAKALLEKAS